VEAEPPTNANISNDWQPAPPPNWMPLATETPEAANKTTAATGESCTTERKFQKLSIKIFFLKKNIFIR